jgi:hypothetical protein
MKAVDYGPLNHELSRRTFVSSILVEPDIGGYGFNLTLMLATEADSLDIVVVSFLDIADLQCDLPLGGWCQVHMLGIRSYGDEPRPCIVEEIEYRTLRFRCRSAKIL